MVMDVAFFYIFFKKYRDIRLILNSKNSLIKNLKFRIAKKDISTERIQNFKKYEFLIFFFQKIQFLLLQKTGFYYFI
jgi:hypothetical protein